MVSKVRSTVLKEKPYPRLIKAGVDYFFLVNRELD